MNPLRTGCRPLVKGLLLAILSASATVTIAATPSDPSPHAIDIPPWFRETFLDFREDVREAANEGKRLIVFFDPAGREVFRIEAYLRPFHLTSSFDYVSSGAYRTEPSFQRYLQARAAKIRAKGGRVDLW